LTAIPARPFLGLVLTTLLCAAAGLPQPARADAVDYEARTVSQYLRQEPPQLDSTKSTDQVSGQVLEHVMEGLTRYDLAGRLVPGVAERWEIREDGATFWLRDDARWSDGEPVTAHDFVFAWRKVVDPANASEYAFITYGIENAEKIVEGELPAEALGVEAVSDTVLEVSFDRPIAYFDKLVAFVTFKPVRESFYETQGDAFGAEAGNLVYNGPFMITQWDHGARMIMKKNPHYWDAESIWLNGIHWNYITSDTTAQLNLFKDEEIVMTDLDSETMQNALEQRWRIQRFDDGSVWYLGLNFREGRPTTNWNLRHALSLVLDPYELINRVIAIPGYRPGKTIFPAWLRWRDGLLRTANPPPEPVTDFDAAQEYIAKAREELGGSIPPLVLLTDDSPTAARISEYLQTVWNDKLGLDVRIDKQIFKQRLAKMTAGEHDIVTAGWGPDYNDPLTFGDLFASWNLNNRGRYSNPDLDACVRTAQNSVDPQVREDAFDCIQRELLEDHGMIPTYERGRIYVVHPRVRDLVRRRFGADVDLTRARITPPDEAN
jgi:oligopeptide transport system substrate-binding protein